MTIDWTVSVPFLFSVAAMIYTYVMTRRQDVEKRFKAGSKRMDEMEASIAETKMRIDALPVKEDMHAMQLTLSEMAGSLNTMSERLRSSNEIMRRLETVVNRHEDHLLDKSK
ncbi:MAG: DUF2730 family protein [Pseudomonadota bacterium]